MANDKFNDELDVRRYVMPSIKIGKSYAQYDQLIQDIQARMSSIPDLRWQKITKQFEEAGKKLARYYFAGAVFLREDCERNRTPDHYRLDGERFLRERWAEFKTGTEPRASLSVPDLTSLQRSERSTDFDRLRMNRKVLGAMRYGLLGAQEKPKWDRIRAMKHQIESYAADGNQEHLADLANYAELEFVEGDGYFKATDDKNHCPIGG